ncbi:40S ribosomal protein S9-2 [Artemisia annua]|uniref:40S ribosomal protein S9-2 n=1 Tax=Artemisia annua TaxID=35608 RepID=A0A2U1NFT6_ARTAN|nr:40S ribosomal protein S9-2 [Artemisia annua]
MCGTIKFDGNDGPIILDYVVLKDGVDTTIELTFNSVKRVRACGSIMAYYGDDVLRDRGFLDAELKLVGEFGLRCQRDLWKMQYALSRIRNAARRTHKESLTDPCVHNWYMAKSIDHARVLIKQRDIRPGRVKRKNQKAAAKKADGGDADEDDED